ncbi:HlyD family secretion protein [Pseudooceanicola sp.]|uniref:HlyD family secretion protein n=1 Tax=Pseudooceanicola sp. TaxID=1914328 RepID=UPI004059170D
MRYLRLVIGTVVILGALYIIVAEQMAGASGDAVVNAPVVTLRTPIAGELDLTALAPGAAVRSGEPVAEIRDPRADRVRLNDLLLERDLALAEANRLRTLHEQLEEKAADLGTRSEDYRSARRQELSAGGERRASDGAGLFEDDKIGTEPDDAALPAEDDGGADAAQSPRAVQREAAKADVFLDDSANAVWNHDLRHLDARFGLAAVEADLKAAQARVSAYENRIDRERTRVNALAAATVSSPVNGIWWERLAADGTHLQRGDPFLRIANCDEVIVTLSVTENVYNTLQPGDTATFRFTGASGTLPATVSRLAGSGAATVYRELAVAPGQKHLERYDVSLILPDLRTGVKDGCMIGRTGRVFFDERPLNLLRRLWN